MSSKSKPTLQDVARLAGVSSMTASRALSRPERVAAQTRERIQQAVQALGYVPNLTASSLITRRSGIIGALITTVTNPILAATLEVLQKGLSEAGYHLLIGETRFARDQEMHLLRAFLGRQLDGLILAYGYHSTETLELLRSAQTPLVELWDLPEGDSPREPLGHVVGFSNWRAGALVGEHLVAAGYRRPAFFGYDDERENLRWQGFRQAVLGGLGVEPLRFKTSAVPQIEDGIEAIEGYRQGRLQFDAAFFTNDMPALGALSSCLRHGIAIPDSIGICGFGDMAIASALYPALTSVHIPAERVGMATVELLRRAIEQPDDDKAEWRDVGCRLVVRESTRPPR